MATASQYYICNKCNFRTTLFSRIQEHLQVHSDTNTKKPSPFRHFHCFDHLKPLKCPSCDFSSESQILLRYHLVHNHDKQQFTLKTTLKMCGKCRFCTQSNYLWIRHRTYGTCKGKKGPTEKNWYLCEKCDYRTPSSNNLENHVISKHTSLKEIIWQQCKKCLKKFKSLYGLKLHQKRGHVSVVDHLNCPECDYSSPLRWNLKEHINRRHNTQPKEFKGVECHICGAKFNEKQILEIHLLRRHSSKVSKEKQYKCDQCPFKTNHRKNLKVHIVNRHLKDDQVKWFNCQHCDYKAKHKYLINKHIKCIHSELVELVQCPHCSFKTKWNQLKSHIVKFHADAVFKCDFCEYKVKSKGYLEIHMKHKHGVGDVELLKCEHCDYNSASKRNLKDHVLTKHDKNAKVLQCKECDYKTIWKNSLNIHMRMHIEPKLTCEKCSFVTKTQKRLQRHMFNKHTEDSEKEKLNCSHCTYFSFSKKNLNQHLKFKHKGGKQFPKTVGEKFDCHNCGYTTNKKTNIYSHITTVHLRTQ